MGNLNHLRLIGNVLGALLIVLIGLNSIGSPFGLEVDGGDNRGGEHGVLLGGSEGSRKVVVHEINNNVE